MRTGSQKQPLRTHHPGLTLAALCGAMLAALPAQSGYGQPTDPPSAVTPGSANHPGSANNPGSAADATPPTLSAEEQAAIDALFAGNQQPTIPRASTDPRFSNELDIGQVTQGLTQGVFGGRQGVPVQSGNPDMSFILDVAGAHFTRENNDPAAWQLGAHDPNRTGFNLQQLELSINSAVDPYLRFDGNIVFSQFGVEVEEAYMTAFELPGGLQARLGQFLYKFGRINATHPHSWHFVDQPLVNGRFFGGEGTRGLGGELSWLAPLPWFAELTVAIGEANNQCCNRSFYGGEDLGITNWLRHPLYTGRLAQFFAFDDSWSLFWGVSMQTGPNPSGQGNRSQIYGTDLYLRWRPVDATQRQHVSLQAEANLRERQLPGRVLRDWGTYAQLVWQPLLRWETGVRTEWVSGADSDPLDPTWTRLRDRQTVQLTFYPTHFSRFRLQVGRDESRWLAQGDQVGWIVFLAGEVVVGAHGAHGF
jgi:hypothetical protein